MAFLYSPFSCFKLSMTRSRPVGTCAGGNISPPLAEALVLALPRNSILSRRGAGDIIGTPVVDPTTGDPVTPSAFNL